MKRHGQAGPRCCFQFDGGWDVKEGGPNRGRSTDGHQKSAEGLRPGEHAPTPLSSPCRHGPLKRQQETAPAVPGSRHESLPLSILPFSAFSSGDWNTGRDRTTAARPDEHRAAVASYCNSLAVISLVSLDSLLSERLFWPKSSSTLFGSIQNRHCPKSRAFHRLASLSV